MKLNHLGKAKVAQNIFSLKMLLRFLVFNRAAIFFQLVARSEIRGSVTSENSFYLYILITILHYSETSEIV